MSAEQDDRALVDAHIAELRSRAREKRELATVMMNEKAANAQIDEADRLERLAGVLAALSRDTPSDDTTDTIADLRAESTMTHPSFAGVMLTPETIQLTREHFADIHRRCIRDAQDGTATVEDIESYVAWQEEEIKSVMTTDRFSVAFLQLAYWLQRGQDVALLP